MNPSILWKIALATAILLAPAFAARPAEKGGGDFLEAYYLETHEHDLAAAARLYERIAADRSNSADVVAEARDRLARCTEDLRAADLATLMPADTIVYAELRNPGEHLDKLLHMLDVVGDPLSNIGQPFHAVPGEDAVVIPQRIQVSPALIECFKSFEGVAAAITDLDFEHEQPHGVLVIHPGDVNLLRGLIETGAQFLRAADPIGGYPAVEICDNGFSATVAFTKRLVIAGTDRSLVQGVIDRLTDEAAPSLASTEMFRANIAKRDAAMIFAFANIEAGMKFAYAAAQHDKGARRDLVQAQAILDLAHLNSASVSLGATDDALQAEFAVSLDEEQMSLAYNLLRTPPMKGRVLKLVPASAAAVFAIGINPQGTDEAAQQVATKTQTIQAVTGLDLGRELFANIREAAVFVMPPVGEERSPLPDVGVVLAVGDAAKSEALWSLLLSLPAKATGGDASAVETMRVDGVTVQAFPVDDHVKIYLARTDGSILVGLTPGAIRASIAAQREGRGVLDDPTMQPATARIGPDTSIALFGHLGRILSVARHHVSPQEAAEMGIVGEAVSETMVTVTVDESQTLLRVAGFITGLPSVERILDTVARAGLLGDQRQAGTTIAIESATAAEMQSAVTPPDMQ